MIAKAYGKTGTRIEQDSIFENGSVAEPPGDGILDTHGVGLYGSPTPAAPPYGPEVQMALQWAIEGMTLVQYDASGPPDHNILRNLIDNKRHELWLYHDGWPANQSSELPPPGARQYMGHAKVIAGYDDQDTSDPADDLCLVYNPWPSYNELLAKLPFNAIKGPLDTYDPYWLPQGDVLGDLPNDIFLVPQDPIQ